MSGRAVALASLIYGCAARPARPSAPQTHQAAATPAPQTDDLSVLAQALVGDDPACRVRARSLGAPLADAAGARTITGDPERDDAVVSAAVVTTVGAAGALLVRSRCGNAWLLGLRWEGAWRGVDARAMVADARPGGCRTTTARAEPAALWTAAPSEILAAWSSEHEDGDSARTTVFGGFQLQRDGALRVIAEPTAIGGEDDANGAAREGTWFVDDVVPPPRDVVIEIRPAHPGLDGVRVGVIERQVWRPTGARLLRVVAEIEAVVPRGSGDGGALAPAR